MLPGMSERLGMPSWGYVRIAGLILLIVTVVIVFVSVVFALVFIVVVVVKFMWSTESSFDPR